MSAANSPKITLVVPTYNRPVLLGDLLHALHRQAWDKPVIVADSSTAEVQEMNRRLCGESSLNVLHISYPGDIEIPDKVAAACVHVATPYLVLCADDDIPIVATINDCVAFLDENKEYVACHGDYYDCHWEKSGVPGIRLNMQVSPVEAPTAVERMLFLFVRYQYFFYSVSRSDPFKEMLDSISTLRSYHFSELWSTLHLAIGGKIGALSQPYCVRNSSVPTIVEGHRYDPNLAFSKSARTFFIDYLAMRRKVCRALRQAAPDLTSADAAQAVDAGFALYLRRCFSSEIALEGLRSRGLIDCAERDRLHGLALDRRVPEAADGVLSRIAADLSPIFARGWPHGPTS